MSHTVEIHEAQTAILRELLFHKEAGFSELQKPTKLDSDHFKFHMKRLVELGYVEKLKSGRYALTQNGKEHANKLDTDTHTIERQPKLSVLIIGWRENAKGETEYLIQQRLKNPYYGYWGRIGGKIRWGETALEAAERELLEETGLRAKLRLVQLYHKMDYTADDKRMLEDKFFLMFAATDFEGEMMEEFEGGRNAWLTQEEINAKEKSFAGLDDSQHYKSESLPPFDEKKYYYDSVDY